MSEVEVLDGRAIKNAAADRELEESIRLHGLLQPIVVRWVPKEGRKHGDFYRVVGGRRRFAAVLALKHETVAATVLEPVGEEEATAMSVAENVDRLALHPMDEADALKAMLGKPGKTGDVAGVAAMLGRSVRYVYDRIRLLDLVPDARKLLEAGRITAAHGIILARLAPKLQKKAIDIKGVGVYGSHSPLWLHESTLFDADEAVAAKADPYHRLKTKTPAELQAWVDKHVRFDAAKDADPILFPETAITLDTLKETRERHPKGKYKVIAITEETYVHPDAKNDQRVYCGASWVHAEKPCERQVLGVFAVGARRGQAIDVCVDKQRCLVHWGDAIRARQKAQKEGEGVGGKVDSLRTVEARREAKRQVQEATDRKLRDERRAQWEKATPSILEAVSEKVKGASSGGGGPLVAAILEAFVPVRCDIPERADSDAVIRRLALFALEGSIKSWGAWDEAPKWLKKHLGLDVKKLIAAANPKPKDEVEKVTKS